MRSPLRFLAVGDSLTAGFCSSGSSYHPYLIHLADLFSSSKIPVVIDGQGKIGERVVPTMVKRLKTLLFKDNNSFYDWVIILGGTNDSVNRTSAEMIFNQGLKLMYDMVLQQTNGKTKLAVMTVIENGYYSPEHTDDTERHILNGLIRNYVENCEDQDRICLIDLDKYIPYHSFQDINQQNAIWDDFIHLTPKGYDQMANCIFEQISNKINQQSSS
jgi:lysophospholipase L1-like esterase